jgi:hypothetical protein
MTRTSAEAVARDREASRLRAAAKRAARNIEDHELDKKLRREYEHVNREHINEQRRMRYGADLEAFANRPFIFWDGEGYSDDDGKHYYMLFGCSMEPDQPLIGSDLYTKACLDYLLDIERRYPDAFHVGFAFDYDVNMILRDLESRHLNHLGTYGITHWQGYRIAYIPGKIFRVSRGNERRGEKKITATVFDTFGFFHSKYTTSLLKFGVATEAEIKAVTTGKSKRGNFTYSDMEYVKRYWQAEISFGPVLMDRVRDACYDAGFFITQWHGPGALATYVLRKRGVNEWKSHDVPTEAQIAIRYAYAGGRFQPWRCGLYCHPVYTADINSAYIYACSLLPNLATGRWRRVVKSDIDRTQLARFGVYHIRYDAGYDKARDNHRRGAFEEIHPLFHRDNRGNLFWPHRTDGWYWSPEAATVARNYSDAEFLEAWVYDDDGTRPFQWVSEEFDKRLQLQHEGNPAEKTFKWALAAMYGAFARSVGWDRKTRQAPRSHELAWAGFITSWCRAEMYKLAFHAWRYGGLISIDTDGVTSTVPFREEWLERGQGENLGQWKLEEFRGILYWQNGFYWLLDAKGKWSTCKTRGIKRGSLDISEALKAYREARFTLKDPKQPVIKYSQNRFIGFKEAINNRDMTKWRTWVQRPTKTQFALSGSTFHNSMWCIKCRAPKSHQMHIVNHAIPSELESYPHRLPWLEEQPEMPREELIIKIDEEADEL